MFDIHPPVQRTPILAAAQAVRDHGGWAVLEACVDVPRQVWEPRLLILGDAVQTIIDAVAEEAACEPGLDLRLTGFSRVTLAPDPAIGSFLCYLAPTLADRPADMDGREAAT
jgi:hypothetical protein